MSDNLNGECNPFLALAKVFWARGDDGEDIARDLANALLYVMKEGTPVNTDHVAEFIRLTNDDVSPSHPPMPPKPVNSTRAE